MGKPQYYVSYNPNADQRQGMYWLASIGIVGTMITIFIVVYVFVSKSGDI